MKKDYKWKGLSLQGKTLQGEMKAINKLEVSLALKKQDIKPLLISKKIVFFDSKINQFDIALFFRQLATLISSGIPMIQCFDLLGQTTKKLAFKNLLTSLKHEIESGKQLGLSLRKFPNFFDELTCSLIQAGEYSGTLNKILSRLADSKEKVLKIKKQISKALFYPSFILIIALMVCFIMLNFVVPRFVDLFESTHTQLPLLTLSVISFSNFFLHHQILSLIPFAFIALFIYFYQTSFQFKQNILSFLLTIPFIRTRIIILFMARWARSLAITFSAGIPLTEALKIIAPALGHPIFTNSIHALYYEVAKGYQLHIAMRSISFFSPLSVQMVKIGEESGTLVLMLEKFAEMVEGDIDHLASTLTQLLEPLIMVILGVLIGGIVIAMYLPIFKLGTVI